MNDGVKIGAICIGGFAIMFAWLALFASPDSPLFAGGARAAYTAQAPSNTADSAEMTREVAEASDAPEYEPEEETPTITGDLDDTEDTGGATTEEEPEVYRYEPEEDTPALDFTDALRETAGDNGKYEAREDGDNIIIDFWDIGIDEDIQRSIDGSLNSQSYLFGVEAVYIALCRAIWEEIEAAGADKHITVNLWDADKEQLFFSVSDGSQDVYDITQGNTEETAAPVNEEQQAAQGGGDGNADNFDTWYLPENQQTVDRYVLNKDSGIVHHPGCSYVAKIAPDNYDTSNLTIAELEAQGYRRCKQREEDKWRWE